LAESLEEETCEHCSQPPSDPQASKKADLAGPGIGDYAELARILPGDYNPLLTPKETQKAIFHLKRYIEDNLCKELSLMMVEVPLIVDAESGVNDMLDRDGSRTPIQFHISNDRDAHPIDGQVVQAATKWKRMALKQFECRPGEGICTDMRAVRKDYFLDHDHSAYVDQWDWERAITAEQRNLEFLKTIVPQDLESPGWRGKVRSANVSRAAPASLPELAGGTHVSSRGRTSRDVSGPAG
jgi:aspartate--ammonia ligase